MNKTCSYAYLVSYFRYIKVWEDVFVKHSYNFTSKEGGHRDLLMSKFRLNKGHPALGMAFETGQHNFTNVLSEIICYTFKSLVTEKGVLCRYVRRAEYPV